MAYRISENETIAASIRRVVREQIDRAFDDLDRRVGDGHETVHRVRKRCKKIRGAVRLVRFAIPEDYKRENAAFRDAARSLSEVRDAQSVLECFDSLMDRFEATLNRDAFDDQRKFLVRRRKMTRDQLNLNERLSTFHSQMIERRRRIDSWRFAEDGFAAIRVGLSTTYSRGRQELAKVADTPVTDEIHRWRKRVKYHWYQMRLLRSLWEAPFQAHCDAADRLSDCLGDDHDLAVLRNVILAHHSESGNQEVMQTLIGLIGRKQLELRVRADSIGRRLFAEKPKSFTKRVEGYWNAWRNDAYIGGHRSN